MARKLTPKAARQMAAARKRFRGGRPAKPTPCPRCAAPCDSAVEAAAHCVGPVRRMRATIARLRAQEQQRAAEGRQEYPKRIRHPTKPAVTVNSAEEEAELLEEWGDPSVLKT